MENKAAGRIAALQRLMARNGIDFYIVPTADFHGSEYAGEYFKLRSFLSGFTGSAGTLVVTQNAAGLWTDGRYFVQAAEQLEGSGITLFKMGEENVPEVFDYLKNNVADGQTVGFDGRVMESELGRKLEELFSLSYDKDLAGELWEDRPPLSATKAWCVPDSLCGMGVDEKLEKVRESMAENGAAHLLISKLDDIMWLYNIRANDVECNPVALSYTFVSMDGAVLFIQEQALNDEVREKLAKSRVEIRKYEELPEYLKSCEIKGKIQYSGKDLNYFLYKVIEGRAELVDAENPTELLKAVKTPKELESIRRFYLLDSVVLT